MAKIRGVKEERGEIVMPSKNTVISKETEYAVLEMCRIKKEDSKDKEDSQGTSKSKKS
jgi:hypothetical protein